MKKFLLLSLIIVITLGVVGTTNLVAQVGRPPERDFQVKPVTPTPVVPTLPNIKDSRQPLGERPIVKSRLEVLRDNSDPSERMIERIIIVPTSERSRASDSIKEALGLESASEVVNVELNPTGDRNLPATHYMTKIIIPKDLAYDIDERFRLNGIRRMSEFYEFDDIGTKGNKLGMKQLLESRGLKEFDNPAPGEPTNDPDIISEHFPGVLP
jgi:hypothetical protein